MTHLTEEQKQVVTQELLGHVAALKTLRSDTPGVPVLPLRARRMIGSGVASGS